MTYVAEYILIDLIRANKAIIIIMYFNLYSNLLFMSLNYDVNEYRMKVNIH